MKYITAFTLGHEVKSQEDLEMIEWQVLEEYPDIVKVCNKFYICIQSYRHSWGTRLFWVLRLGCQIIPACFTGGNNF